MILLDTIESARRELLTLQDPSGGWAYRRGAPPCSEPTALAGLALLAASARSDDPAARRGADWLATIQRTDGSLGVSAAVPEPGWATPLALLLWKAANVHGDRRASAERWLLARKGRALSRTEDPNHIAGHDVSLVGWPWVLDTHSWLEPTATAILALGRVGRGNHPRVVEGLSLIRDRAVDSGGWNYGNKAVFGRPLRAQPGPTGLALLSLATTEPRSPVIDRAIGYLHATLPTVRAPASLGWGLFGLRAWNALPADAEVWLAAALSAVAGRADAAPRLALLLLAAEERALDLFGRAVTGSGAISNVDKGYRTPFGIRGNGGGHLFETGAS